MHIENNTVQIVYLNNNQKLDRYSIRFDETVAFNTKAMQNQRFILSQFHSGAHSCEAK